MPNVEMLIGPPGTGKTHTLLTIVEEELSHGTKPENIMFCSFTQAGSNAGRDRAAAKFSKYRKEDFRHFKTIHALCFRETEISRSMVVNSSDYRKLATILDMPLPGHIGRLNPSIGDKYLSCHDLIRNNPIAGWPHLAELSYPQYVSIKDTWEKYKKLSNKVDFTDMLENYLKFGKPIENLEVAILDEAQDTTSLQWKVFFRLAHNARRIIVVGDDAQAIYNFSGADVKKFLRMTEKCPVRVLDQSYRLPKAVLDYSNRIFNLIRDKYAREFKPRRDGNGEIVEGFVEYVDSVADIPFNADSSYFILGRTNRILDGEEMALRDKGILYARKGMSSVTRGELSLIRKYEDYRSRNEEVPNDTILYSRLKAGYKISDPWYESFDIADEDISYLQSFLDDDRETDSKVVLSTFHAAKGLEADYVVLALELPAKAWKEYVVDADNELRCYYVAATRAKKGLYIIRPRHWRALPVLHSDDVRVVVGRENK